MNNHLKTAESLTRLLDNQFKIFGFKFGLDPLLGLFYGAGDVVAAVLSLYLIWIAVQMKLPQDKISEMVRNVFLDFLLGLVPVVGQAGDFFFKANSMNLKILKKYAPTDIVEGKIV